MLDDILGAVGSAARTFVLLAGAVVLLGVMAHALTWLVTRRGSVVWVWTYWNALGGVLVASGLAAIGYGWLVLGLSSAAGGALAGVGLLLLSAGLWMLMPV